MRYLLIAVLGLATFANDASACHHRAGRRAGGGGGCSGSYASGGCSGGYVATGCSGGGVTGWNNGGVSGYYIPAGVQGNGWIQGTTSFVQPPMQQTTNIQGREQVPSPERDITTMSREDAQTELQRLENRRQQLQNRLKQQ